jgi:4'-phosphopantetheinyl transferase
MTSGSAPARIAVAALAELADRGESAGARWLTGQESARLAAMKSPSRRRQFLAGHWFARELAADLLAIAPSRLTLGRDDSGRPRLALDDADCGWFVSLSHSGDWLACALAPAPVGIDLEFPNRPRDLDALARFTFSTEERERLSALPESTRSAAFYATWTLKEARGKRSGEGLLPGRARSFSARPCNPGDADAATWTVGAGTLALAGDGVQHVVTSGLPAAVAPSFWRYIDAAD